MIRKPVTKAKKRPSRLDEQENANYRVKSKPISFRISRELLERVETARGARELERSEFLEEVIGLGLNEIDGTARSDAMQALLAIVELLANRCSVRSPDGKRFLWNEDPRVFEAMMHALPLLLSRFAPKGSSALEEELQSSESNIDEWWRKTLSSPQSLGEYVRGWIIGDLDHYELVPARELEGTFQGDRIASANLSQHTIDIARIRRHLNYRRE